MEIAIIYDINKEYIKAVNAYETLMKLLLEIMILYLTITLI